MPKKQKIFSNLKTSLTMKKVFVSAGLLLAVGISIFVGSTFNVQAVGYTPGDVIINEFVINTSAGTLEWYELLNTRSFDIDLTSWTLSSAISGSATIGSIMGTSSKIIPANGILVVSTPYTPANDEGDVVQILSPSATAIHAVSFGNQANPPAPNHANAPGLVESAYFLGGTWSIASSPTKGWYNGAPAPTIASIVSTINSSGVVTNMGTLDNPSAATGLYFEKRTEINDSATAVGRLTFAGPLNLTNDSTTDLLQNLGTKMEAAAGSMDFDARTALDLKNAGASVSLYKVNTIGYDVSTLDISKLTVKDDDGNVLSGVSLPDFSDISTSSSNGGTFTFTTSHFTQFGFNPILSEVTPVASTTSSTSPIYTFSSNVAGTYVVGGDCGVTSASTINGNNTITFGTGPLSPATYSNCTVKVIDGAGASSTLAVSEFTVDSSAIDSTFDSVSSTLSGTGIYNNLDTVTGSNYTSFSGLFFEKRSNIADPATAIGRITFDSALDLSNSETITFLQNLGSKLDMNDSGSISLDFTGATNALSLKGVAATIKFYGLNSLGISNMATGSEVMSKLVAYDDQGNLLDVSSLISSSTSPTYLGACEVMGGCYVFTVGVNHFTRYDIDNTAPTGSITNITDGAYLHGTTTIQATSSDSGSGVAKVEFYYYSIGTKIGEDTTAPYSIDWDTTGLDGSHDILVKVYDNAGNSYTSDTTVVVVDNSAPSVTKLGDGNSDYSLPSTCPSTACNRGDIYGTQLSFSDILDANSKTAVESAISAGANTAPRTYVWSGKILRIYATTSTTFANDVSVTVANLTGATSTNLLLIDSKYQYIQDAIDSASTGATITVPTGTYSECLIVNKSITLTSTSTANTVLDVGGCTYGIDVRTNNVTIKNLTVVNSDDFYNSRYAIFVGAHENLTGIVLENLIMTDSQNGRGISVTNASGQIKNNDIQNFCSGIYLSSSTNFTLDGNIISNNGTRSDCDMRTTGIDVVDSSAVDITNNIISNNDVGVHVFSESTSVTVNKNKIFANNGAFGSGPYGLLNDNVDAIVNATMNWWGDARGPVYGVSSSTGDVVSSFVNFSPWYGNTDLTILKGTPDAETRSYSIGDDFIATSTVLELIIPSGTVITGTTTWNGDIGGPVSTTTATRPTRSGFTTTIRNSIEIGFPESKVTLSKAAKLTFYGDQSKKVGYTRPGESFTEITSTCGENSQTWADENLSAEGECKINNGSDLVVWTKHFTTFTTYTQVLISSGGGSGGSSSSSGSYVVATTTPTTTLTTLNTTSTSTPTTTQSTSFGSAKYVFLKDFKIGATGQDVVELQKILVASGDLVLPSGVQMGNFGRLTQVAVIKYQIRNGISPALGFVGPMTRAKLNSGGMNISTEQLIVILKTLNVFTQEQLQKLILILSNL